MSSFFLDDAGTRYYLGVPFSHGEMNYTAAGATTETFKALGFKEVEVQPRPDDRFYIVNSYPREDGSWDATPRDLDGLKASLIQRCKMEAGSFLAPTDWLIVRQQETGEDAPEEVLRYRQAVRAASNAYEEAVRAAATLAELQALPPLQWPAAPERSSGSSTAGLAAPYPRDQMAVGV